MREKDKPEELQAYITLMTKNQGRLRVFIRSLLPGSPDVDDVLQNTNIVLWTKRKEFTHGTNFLAWAFKITRFQVLSQHKRNKRDGKLVFSDKFLEYVAESTPIDRPYSRILSALERCLARLSPSQRKIVDARYERGQSLEQYAEKMGCSAGSLRISLHRIRASLQTCIKKTLSVE
ncbi:MAG: RNA polymerase sigma-70 factor (ECF subfamily) [Rubritalea sp.]|jgi:RNA polymerase sigma-70 factor (ECF subfamily)